MEIIAKKYRVLKSLGSGAMGEVFLVLTPKGEAVALKLLKTSDVQTTAGALSQFENEFRVLKKLDHPNIGKIFDYGYDPDLKKVFFTSPWLKGSDLYAASSELDFSKIEELFVQLLRAINYLHQKGIIHCDLKPGNIFVEKETVQLLDFGLAGYWGDSIVGTPTYLAPEIYRGDRHSIASDLYAVGVVFYTCLTRTQPFSGASLQEVYDRHRTYTPPLISKVNPLVPSYISDIVATLLAKKPEERYQSAAAVIEEIAAYSKIKYSIETPETLLSYLPTASEVIGREEVRYKIDHFLSSFLDQKNKNPFALLSIVGKTGMGKSKIFSQVKSELQIKQIVVEASPWLANEADFKLADSAEALLLDPLQTEILADTFIQGQNAWLQFLEKKILSVSAKKFLLVITGNTLEEIVPFRNLFPPDATLDENIELTPLTEEDMKTFLETVIGQKGIPTKFISELYRNTGGNPGQCLQIVQQLIEKELLFDKSGRWSRDLLGHLTESLQRIETPPSLEEGLAKEYHAWSDIEKQVMSWLILCPHGLSEPDLIAVTDQQVTHEMIQAMLYKKIIREETGRLFVYRPAFIAWLTKLLNSSDIKKRHAHIATTVRNLKPDEVLYHQSLGENLLMVQKALEKRGEILQLAGRQEEALECYVRLLSLFREAPLLQKLGWGLKGAEIYIWLNRFNHADQLLKEFETDIEKEGYLPPADRLHWLEKRGVCALHLEKIDSAKKYFTEANTLAGIGDEFILDQARLINDLAQIDLLTGQHEQAIHGYEKSRQLLKKCPENERARVTNNDLGAVLFQRRNYEKAAQILEEDVRIFSCLTNHEPWARALYMLGESYRAMKMVKKAVTAYEKCIGLCHEGNYLSILLRAYNGLGNIYWGEAKYKEALEAYQQGVEIATHLKDPTTKAALLANQGLIYAQQKNAPQASRRFYLAKQILEQKEVKMAYEQSLLAKCYDELASIALEDKDSMKALAFAIDKVHLLETSQSQGHDYFEAHRNLASLYLDNRIVEGFRKEIEKLVPLAINADEKRELAELKERWLKIETFDQQEMTQKVE